MLGGDQCHGRMRNPKRGKDIQKEISSRGNKKDVILISELRHCISLGPIRRENRASLMQ